MKTYGQTLKLFIDLTGAKLSNIAAAVGYDDSYISKWCNKGNLPAQKVINEVNESLADFFTNEIEMHHLVTDFLEAFHIEDEPEDLNECIYVIFKTAYRHSVSFQEEKQKITEQHAPKVLLYRNEIYNFFNNELPGLINSSTTPLDAICTIDICQQFENSDPMFIFEAFKDAQVNVHIREALSLSILREDSDKHLKNIYYFINKYDNIHFDFFDDSLVRYMNTFAIRDKIALIFSMDRFNRIQTAVVMSDPVHVNQIFSKASSGFNSKDVVIHSTNIEEFYKNGYRTEFYAQNSYQIFLTKGFEYLLPSDTLDLIAEKAKNVTNDLMLSRIARKLKITWEEIFEHGTIDFYTLKSSLLRYLEDGEIIFTDIKYKMSIDERKAHMANVQRILDMNPNIHFYVIDDEFIPNAEELLHTSFFSNRKKMFLKNANRYESEHGPFFYSILNEEIINYSEELWEKMKTNEHVYYFDKERIASFMERYGSMINRILSLSEFLE